MQYLLTTWPGALLLAIIAVFALLTFIALAAPPTWRRRGRDARWPADLSAFTSTGDPGGGTDQSRIYIPNVIIAAAAAFWHRLVASFRFMTAVGHHRQLAS